MNLRKKMQRRALEKAYKAKLKEAMEAQRAGKIQVYAERYVEAEAMAAKLESYE